MLRGQFRGLLTAVTLRVMRLRNPPLTGRIAINPWADFNLSGQFVSETWGLISPGMPQTAARIGIH